MYIYNFQEKTIFDHNSGIFSYAVSHNDTIINTHAGRLLYKYMYLSLYCKGSKRVTQGLRVRGSWRPNRNCNILTPYSYVRQRCVFLVLLMLNRRPWAHSAGWWLSLLHLITNISGPQTPSGFPRAPSVGRGFLYHISSIFVSNSTATATRTGTQLSYIIVQRPLDRPLDLWNRMFNRHQAEITVMQFRGHSLPVRQFMRVSWDFLAYPILSANFRPRDFLS